MKSCRSWKTRRSGQMFVGRGRGFTMVELLVVLGVLGLLAALLMGAFGPARSTARRTSCDSRLKALAIALDAFRQERGRYPRALSELVRDKYISDREMLRCPDDPDESSAGYEPFYVLRGARNDPRYPQLPTIGQLPTIVCPFHETSAVGVQAFGGLQTHQYSTRAAVLVSASAASVTHPGEEPVPGQAGMPLHGGDLIETSGAGAALIQFFDGSRCELQGGAKVTVLQSFLQSGEGDLYTLVRQAVGNVAYSVSHGSKFDVSTPTATAGALGTEFLISISGQAGAPGYSEWWINSSPNDTSDVSCAIPREATIIARHRWTNVGEMSLSQTPMNGGPRPSTNATPTPGPTATSQPGVPPAAKPTEVPKDGSDD